ncbi:hypothetical protein E2542_SST19515 [Spatholobus suberectus]|nr:hypothetical protein E2542_SST19515 [Spatholobus suberectus]
MVKVDPKVLQKMCEKLQHHTAEDNERSAEAPKLSKVVYMAAWFQITKSGKVQVRVSQPQLAHKMLHILTAKDDDDDLGQITSRDKRRRYVYFRGRYGYNMNAKIVQARVLKPDF